MSNIENRIVSLQEYLEVKMRAEDERYDVVRKKGTYGNKFISCMESQIDTHEGGNIEVRFRRQKLNGGREFCNKFGMIVGERTLEIRGKETLLFRADEYERATREAIKNSVRRIVMTVSRETKIKTKN